MHKPNGTVVETRPVRKVIREGRSVVIDGQVHRSGHSPLLKILHWIVAILVLFVGFLGFILGFIRDDAKLDFYLIHESFGFLVFWLMLVRVGARLVSPPHAVEAPAWERRVRRVVHGSLYLAPIVMPVSGFLATNAHGFPLVWFGLVDIWSPVGKAPGIAPVLSAIHAFTAWVLLALIALHLGAVLFHHVIRRDQTLFRML